MGRDVAPDPQKKGFERRGSRRFKRRFERCGSRRFKKLVCESWRPLPPLHEKPTSVCTFLDFSNLLINFYICLGFFCNFWGFERRGDDYDDDNDDDWQGVYL